MATGDPTTTTTTTTSTTTEAPGAFKRPEALYFVGARLPNGEPAEHLAGYGIDARDFEPGDPWYARLTDEQVKLALDSKLYRRSKPAAAQEG